MEVQIDEPGERLIVLERLGIELMVEALDVRRVHEQRRQAASGEPDGLRTEFSRRDSQIDDLLNEMTCAQDDFIEVEAGEAPENSPSPPARLG